MPEPQTTTSTTVEHEMISVACPQCSEKTFSFSSNILRGTRSIIFSCTGCGASVNISRTDKSRDILVFVE